MWRANLKTYEKQVHPSNHNIKSYKSIYMGAPQGKITMRVSKRKFKTANETLNYAYRFNARMLDCERAPYQGKMGMNLRAGLTRKDLSWGLILNWWRSLGNGLKLNKDLISSLETLLFDVSLWQGAINFVKMLAFPSYGVIIKAGQANYADPRFIENWAKAKAAGIPRGTYFFYDSRVEPKKQALVWWNLIKNDPGELKHWADYEENYGGAYAGHRNFRIFLEEFIHLGNFSKTDVGIYTGYYYWLAHAPTNLTELSWFADFWLWLAWYTNNPANVLIPKPWVQDKVIFWQKGTPAWGERAGVSSIEIDEDYFIRPRDQFKPFFKLGGTPVDPPTGEIDMTVFNALRVNATALNGRATPGGTIIFSGGFLKNDILLAKDVVQDGISKWYPVFAAIRLGSLVALPTTEVFAGNGGTANYLTLLTAVEASEEIAKYPEITLSLEADAGYPNATLVWKPNP